MNEHIIVRDSAAPARRQSLNLTGLPLLGLRLHRDEAMAEAMAAKQPVGRYAPTSLIAHELTALACWCLDIEGADPC